ncbi:MBL fold metallo-hydrolase [Nocardia sp. NPDC059239]|uniref:MBL fold metallo-hydrolase n=1 Tax=unclassified Nocardia TaxID=2637762 RepID=UPI00369385FB
MSDVTKSIAAVGNTSTASQFGTPGGQLTELRRGVYAWIQPDGSWWINNAGAIAGGNGVVLVDTCATAERTHAFLNAVDTATSGTPVRAAINTHVHGDHTHGNALLPDTARIIGHRETRDGIASDTVLTAPPPVWNPMPHWGIDRHRLPDVIADGPLSLFAGDREIIVQHPGYHAHTSGDLITWLPHERILFAGDLLFNEVTPLAFMGSMEGARRVLTWIAEFEPAVVVPGHGPIIERTELSGVLDAHDRYYRFVLDTAREGRAKGWTPLESARNCDLGAFGHWGDPERIVLNLHRAYCDADGTDLDPAAAFADAVAFHGGPLHCHA